jgi:lipoyl(octanoyl) transferase
VPYREAWELQRTLQRELIGGDGPEVLLVLSHPPVITRGKSSPPENVYASAETLAKRCIELIDVERGGDVTYHGPGQLVLYPIINLQHHRRDVGWYMRMLEEVAIRTLAELGLRGLRSPGRTGVWVGDGEEELTATNGTGSDLRKIASLGVRISRWCTLHGIALNVKRDEDGFSLINPCGLGKVSITSAERELGREISMGEVELSAIRNFSSVFNYMDSCGGALG